MSIKIKKYDKFGVNTGKYVLYSGNKYRKIYKIQW